VAPLTGSIWRALKKVKAADKKPMEVLTMIPEFYQEWRNDLERMTAIQKMNADKAQQDFEFKEKMSTIAMFATIILGGLSPFIWSYLFCW